MLRFFGADEMLAIILQLFDRIANVFECLVAAFFFQTIHQVGTPALGELLDTADIEVAVMKEGFERGHVTGQKAAVLADAVAAHG